jgi:hypothetical protein
MVIERVAKFVNFRAEYGITAAGTFKWPPSANVGIGGCASLQPLSLQFAHRPDLTEAGVRFSEKGGAADYVGTLALRVTKKCIGAPNRRRRAILLRRGVMTPEPAAR